MTNKTENDITALVVTAVKQAGKKAFFETNEYISKRLVKSQYINYANLASVSHADIYMNIGTEIKKSKLSNKLAALVKEGVLNKSKNGGVNLYFLTDTDYLTNS